MFKQSVLPGNTIELDMPETKNFYGADPLLLACIQYRRYSGGNFPLSFYSQEEVDQLLATATLADHKMAKDIKQYYSNKYMIRQLRDGTLTEYKTRTLQFFTHKDYTNVPNKYVGIAYKLPFFYDHDIKLTKMFEEHANEEVVYNRHQHSIDVEELTYIDKLVPFSKNFPHNHYWFKDADGCIYLFKGKTPNPLLSLFEKILKLDGKVKIVPEKTRITHKTFYEYKYYELSAVEFDHE